MKLTPMQIAATRESLSATPLPDDHPVMGQLKEAFGEHTFFLDQDGLSVFVDPSEAPEQVELPEGDPRLVLIAVWTDEKRQALGPVEPVDTGVTLPATPPPGAA
jgi:hypothetical protein